MDTVAIKKNMHEKILVVDDDRDMCSMLSTLLEDEGYEIDKAYDGGEAIQKIRAKDYNLMILDYKLPDMDGINLLKEIRQAKPSPEFLKVVMISAYGCPPLKAKAKKLGVYRFLNKPFNLSRLVNVVKDVLAKNQGEVDRSSQGLSRFMDE